jgi:transcriptional regulator with XRE-family HTH domain
MQAETITPMTPGYTLAISMGRPTSKERSPFGARLHAARTEAGLSQVQVADHLGTTQSAYAVWERDEVALKPAQISKLCKLLNVRVEELYEDKPAKRTSGPVGKARRLFEEVSELPRRQQQRILGTVEDMLTAQKAKAS